jgi:hypothetical protein
MALSGQLAPWLANAAGSSNFTSTHAPYPEKRFLTPLDRATLTGQAYPTGHGSSPQFDFSPDD